MDILVKQDLIVNIYDSILKFNKQHYNNKLLKLDSRFGLIKLL